MTLWGGRFSQQLEPGAWSLNASIGFDRRMASQDVRGSIAWAGALFNVKILSAEEHELIVGGLQRIAAELQNGQFTFLESDEDIHTAVERRLVELVGPVGGKIHTGRSRNDQVATDFRLWLLDNLPVLDGHLHALQTALVQRAGIDMGILMPGYTHLQRAQPVLLSHWWLSHFWPVQRDRQRLAELSQHSAVLPLGAGALAGTPLAIDRPGVAQALGFIEASPNSIDAVSDRDFAAEFLFVAALVGVHISRLAEQIVLFNSAEFGFFELDDRYSTGSSLMPQKKNPDVFELARGKAGNLIGMLSGLLTTLKGLPSAYDKDLQEDKPAVFAAYDTLSSILPVIAGALETLLPIPERLRGSIDASMMATDLADYLVERGIPFRQAHALTGQVVQAAIAKGKSIDDLSNAEFQEICPAFGPDVCAVFEPDNSIARRSALGGTALPAVQAQLMQARSVLTSMEGSRQKTR